MTPPGVIALTEVSYAVTSHKQTNKQKTHKRCVDLFLAESSTLVQCQRLTGGAAPGRGHKILCDIVAVVPAVQRTAQWLSHLLPCWMLKLHSS